MNGSAVLYPSMDPTVIIPPGNGKKLSLPVIHSTYFNYVNWKTRKLQRFSRPKTKKCITENNIFSSKLVCGGGVGGVYLALESTHLH